MKLAIIGARGQVGSEVVRAAKASAYDVVSIDHDRCDVTDADSVRRALEETAPLDAVVNTAAFHRVDECEQRPDRAVAVNARGAFNVAAAAKAVGAAVVYISTDYVFDGAKHESYVETDAPAPLNVYGATKYAGEELTCQENPRASIARISSVFGSAVSSGKGANFVERMLDAARAGEQPQVRNDLTMSPTSAEDAAKLLVELLERGAQPGVYHLANAGSCTWLELANAVLELCGLDVRAVPVKTAERPGLARRPQYSALTSERLPDFGLTARPWRDALRDYLELRKHT